ncbi:MAG: hypothetical protein NT014_01300 [Candidatus Omnitrophica bacterium]|nr:hypothetical protein [Candidatus Omnitrophota bacterium]
MLRQLKKGQSTAEYAIVIGLVIAAAVAMQVYVKRGIQGKMKNAVDYNDPEAAKIGIGADTQYEPNYQTTTNMKATRESKEDTEAKLGGGVVRTITGEDVSTRTGKSTILGVNE